MKLKPALTFFNAKDGVPVRFPDGIGGEKLDSSKLYFVRLRDVVCDEKEGFTYPQSEHIFTEKELNRATVRYYTEMELVVGSPSAPIDKRMLGYIGVRTYTNSHGVLTTRFVVRFDGRKVEGLNGSSSCIGLFTARELKRSKERVAWYLAEHESCWKKIWRWVHG